ncbi:MAG: hypothetical protein CM15mV92_380 [Caudoviricetes sp.]|nr:MAG: hypothetical protein CM15mV92_380 [Caudoviricetes sp.]
MAIADIAIQIVFKGAELAKNQLNKLVALLTNRER